jgi:hypothetical protein
VSTSKAKTVTADAPVAAPAVDTAPKGASLEGLPDNYQIEIAHPDTGQTYGVSVKAFRERWQLQGFEPVRMGTGGLLPGDPRAPKDVPPDTAFVQVGEAQPAPASDGKVRTSDLSDSERELAKAVSKES